MPENVVVCISVTTRNTSKPLSEGQGGVIVMEGLMGGCLAAPLTGVGMDGLEAF